MSRLNNFHPTKSPLSFLSFSKFYLPDGFESGLSTTGVGGDRKIEPRIKQGIDDDELFTTADWVHGLKYSFFLTKESCQSSRQRRSN